MPRRNTCLLFVCISLLYGKINPEDIGEVLLANSIHSGEDEMTRMLSHPGGVEDIYRTIQKANPRWISLVQHLRLDDPGLRWAERLILDEQVDRYAFLNDKPTFENLETVLEQIIDAGWNDAMERGLTRGPTKKRSFVRTRETEARNNAGRAYPNGHGWGYGGYPGPL